MDNSIVKITKKIFVNKWGTTYSNFKIVFCGNTEYWSSYTSMKYRIPGAPPIPQWKKIEKADFKGRSASSTKEENDNIVSYIVIRTLFEAYKFALKDRANFDMEVKTLQKKLAWEEGYRDYDYHKVVKITSRDSYWGSESNISVTCHYFGHVTNEGGNHLLDTEGYIRNPQAYLMVCVTANPDSLSRRLPSWIKKDQSVIQIGLKQNHLATRWFVEQVLPTYYMLANSI